MVDNDINGGWFFVFTFPYPLGYTTIFADKIAQIPWRAAQRTEPGRLRQGAHDHAFGKGNPE